MKRVFLAISIVILLLLIYLVIINFNNYADINFIYNSSTAIIHKAVRLSTFTILVLLSGLFVGAGTVYMFLDVAKEKAKVYQRELEKTAISGTASASKVEVLEAKIKTLEKAFETVIDERTKLELQIKTLNDELDNLNKNN